MRLREAINTFRGHRVPNLSLIGRKKWWFLLSGVLVAVSLGGLIFRGLNLSIEFEGGALLRYPNRTGVSTEDVRSTMARFGRSQAEVQVLGEGEITVRTQTLNTLGDRREALLSALARQAGVRPKSININAVGPTWGSQISRKALQGLLIFLVMVTIYISLRFEWKMALAAQGALLHDLIITAGIYALVGREVTPATVIAVLTILGFSLYDTVVIFDKVKENTDSLAMVSRETYSGAVNTSLNQTLMRSVNTSVVALLPILALLLFGGETLKDFAFALFVGLASSTYSSIFLASPLLAVLKEREPRYAQIRARAARTAGRSKLRPVPAPRAQEGVTEERLEPVSVSASARPGSRPGSQVQRRKKKPPQKRRRR